MKKCTYPPCEQDNEDNAAYCWKCGTPLDRTGRETDTIKLKNEEEKKRLFIVLDIVFSSAAGFLIYDSILSLLPADWYSTHPNYIVDFKELGIGFLSFVAGSIIVMLGFKKISNKNLQQNFLYGLKTGMVCTVVGFGLAKLFSFEIIKPHWFTTNMEVKAHFSTGEEDVSVRVRYLPEYFRNPY